MPEKRSAYAASTRNLMTKTPTPQTGGYILEIRPTQGYADWNCGYKSSPEVEVYYYSGAVQFHSRAILYFDLSAITGTVDSASLQIRTVSASSSFTMGVARILREWGPATTYHWHEALTGEATWNSAKHGSVLWSSPGCDGEGSDRVAFTNVTVAKGGTVPSPAGWGSDPASRVWSGSPGTSARVRAPEDPVALCPGRHAGGA